MELLQVAIPHFHAHIYFEPETRASAEEFRQLIRKYLEPKLSYHGALVDRPIGPHPVPMFEINFLTKHFAEVVEFLMQNHRGHSVLIHPETGNDLKDHTVHALWLGRQMPLDLSILS